MWGTDKTEEQKKSTKKQISHIIYCTSTVYLQWHDNILNEMQEQSKRHWQTTMTYFRSDICLFLRTGLKSVKALSPDLDLIQLGNHHLRALTGAGLVVMEQVRTRESNHEPCAFKSIRIIWIWFWFCIALGASEVTEVLCWFLCVHVRTLAAVFWMSWSLPIISLGNPAKSATVLQPVCD